MSFKSLYVAVVGLFILLCSSAAPAQDYEIRFDHSSKVGDKYHLSATGNELLRITLTAAGRVVPTPDEGFTVELTADAKVLEVSANGWATAKSFTIIKSMLTKDGAIKPLLPEGTIVLAILQNRRTVFQINGNPVEPHVAKALSSLITLHNDDATNDDELFGARSRKKVGESWNVNIEAAIEFIKGMGGQAKKEDIKGTMTLEKVEQQHLFIHGAMNVDNVLLPIPVGFNTERGVLLAEFASKLPLAGSDDSFATQQKVSINLTGRRPATLTEPEMSLNMIYETSATYQLSHQK